MRGKQGTPGKQGRVAGLPDREAFLGPVAAAGRNKDFSQFGRKVLEALNQLHTASPGPDLNRVSLRLIRILGRRIHPFLLNGKHDPFGFAKTFKELQDAGDAPETFEKMQQLTATLLRFKIL